MDEKRSSHPAEGSHSYLDVRPTGPPRWVLVVGALLVATAVLGIFYGLNALNRGTEPTPSPDLAALTLAAGTGTPLAAASTFTPSPPPSPTTPTPTSTVTATTEPPTYTVQQGDSLISIAQRLNVDVNTLTALNQLGGETIFPGQVLFLPPTVTPWPETGPFPHVVGQGETLLSIAALYSVTVGELRNLNGLASDTIFVGQRILIPGSGVRPATPTPTPEPWEPAIITGELDGFYSLRTIKGRFTLHIPPGTRAATPSESVKVARLVETALEQCQRILRRRLSGRFEVYVADALFEAPHTYRRALSFPDARSLFLLYDGSGAPAERLYFTTYALTQLVAAQTLGQAAAPLLREGLAVYAGGQALVGESDLYLPLAQFCAAYQAADRLPRVSRALSFEGHLGHMDQYFAVGCFVGYLIEQEEDSSAFAQLYTMGDYRAAYGRRLTQLESDWITSLRDAADALPFDPVELVRVAAEVDDAYRRLWDGFEGTPSQLAAYQRLDRARVALLQGRLSTAQEHLQLFESLLSAE